MQATNDLRAILNAAEQAAAREDAASAERLLREALALQESTAGSPREEIAKTLNNLAVVCEMTGKTADAETCYRRAYAIATATLPASDPFVTTSRENLAQFCTSQGIPFERPAAVAARAPSPDPPKAAPAPVPVPAPVTTSPPPRAAVPAPTRAAPAVPQPQPSRSASPIPAPSSTPSSSRAIVIGVIILVALAIAFVALRYWFASSASPASVSTTPVSQSESASEPAPEPAPAPAPTPAPTATREPEPIAAAPAPAPAPAATRKPEPPRTTGSSPALTLVTAQVCRSLSVADGSWRCDAVSDRTGPGPLYFYTRVASARDTKIEHRWYRDDRLHQRVELNIGANQGGYRTYSRTTVGADRAGKWRVELRSTDGRVLHQETFSVR